ncbi:hypothetical protein L218DRAFT_6616 [Marasmius fiardii PR-910]|nr:hypothetical protein L218DRAFT_6616 [Marasmius fiardii PR-910]
MEEHAANDLWGKRTDVVDFGGEVDYSGMQWFKEPPPEKPQPPPQQQLAAYDPEPAVVQQNEHFGYALSAAPNVLYGRWKQYGQVCGSSSFRSHIPIPTHLTSIPFTARSSRLVLRVRRTH